METLDSTSWLAIVGVIVVTIAGVIKIVIPKLVEAKLQERLRESEGAIKREEYDRAREAFVEDWFRDFVKDSFDRFDSEAAANREEARLQRKQNAELIKEIRNLAQKMEQRLNAVEAKLDKLAGVTDG